MASTQISIDQWMVKQDVVCTYNRIIFSLKKEGNSDICYNRDEPWGHYLKISQTQKDKYCMVLLLWGN